MRALRLIAKLVLLAVLLLSSTEVAAAEQEAWGSVVSGIRLGLSLTPAHSVLPSDLTILVSLQNTTSTPKTIPLSLCGSIPWQSYGKIAVRVDGGKTYRVRMHGMADLANVHPHEPLRIAGGERLEAKLSLKEIAQFLPDEESDMGLFEQLLSARQIELWAEFSSDEKRSLKVESGHLRRRFALTPLAQPLGTACIVQLATSDGQVCALNRVGTPHCWGDTAPGWDPDTKRHEVSRPKPVPRLRLGVKSLGFGASGLCAITTDSGVLCLSGGNNSVTSKQIVNPVRVVGLPNELSTLFLGLADQCALTTRNSLWCWGRRAPSANSVVAADLMPATAMTALGEEVAEVTIGWQHACARTRRGSVMCWGDNKLGQLGSGNLTPSETPIAVTGLHEQVTKVVSGLNYSCALRADGKVNCWGQSLYGALGHEVSTAHSTPFELTELGSENVNLFAAHNQTCALKSDGRLLCLGVVAFREGLLSTQNPVLIDSLPTDVADVTIGPRDACARMRSGSLWCWGETLRAIASPNATKLPQGAKQVAGLTEVASVHVGNSFLCARSQSGTVHCWGDGSGGQLGAGSLNMTAQPVRIAVPCGE